MASADPTPVEIETDCAICHDLFSEPKILPCAHILCRHCLLSWLASSKEGGCPSCRFPILAPSKKSEKPEAAVDHLPSDFAMAALVRSKRLLSQEHVCGGCGQTAVSVCLHCFDMLCASCTKIHGNLKATRQHKLSDLSTITAERLAVEQPAFCLHHSDKLAELYCPTHDKAMCHLCASMEHRTCLEPKPFEQHAKLLRDKLLCTSEMLRLAEEKIDFSIKDLDQRLADAKKKAENSITEINSACDKLFRLVKACRERLNERVLKSMKGVEESVKTTRTTFLDQRRRINSHRRIVNRLQDTCPCDELDKATVIAEDCLRELDMNTVLDSSIMLMATFSIGSITLMKLEKELSFLGEERFVDILSEARFWKFSPQTNAQFTNNGLTVEKVGGTSIIMVSTSPMKTNNLFEVRIDKVKEGSKDFFPCGVLFSQSQPLAETYLRGQEGAIVFSSDIFVHGKVKGSSSLERKLKGLKEGTRVGFVRDLGGFLHLYIDGEKQWVYVRNVFNPCYVFFELLHVYQKMTCLPMTSICKAID